MAVLMLAAGGTAYWLSSDPRMGFALIAALVAGISAHLEGRLEKLRVQLENMSDTTSASN